MQLFIQSNPPYKIKYSVIGKDADLFLSDGIWEKVDEEICILGCGAR